MKTPRSVFRIAILLLLLVGARGGNAQDTVPLNLHFERVNLSNGRVLKDAALTSFNRGSNLVYVLEDRKLKPYPRALFPGFVTARIDDRLKEYPAQTSSSQPAPRSHPRGEPSPPSRSDPIGSPERNAADRAAIEAPSPPKPNPPPSATSVTAPAPVRVTPRPPKAKSNSMDLHPFPAGPVATASRASPTTAITTASARPTTTATAASK